MLVFYGWRQCSTGADTSIPASEACYCRAENVDVVPVVIPGLSFGNVQRQVLLRHLVIAAHRCHHRRQYCQCAASQAEPPARSGAEGQ